MSVAEPRHGTYQGYSSDRCRCEECRAAKATYSRQRRSATRPAPASSSPMTAGRASMTGYATGYAAGRREGLRVALAALRTNAPDLSVQALLVNLLEVEEVHQP